MVGTLVTAPAGAQAPQVENRCPRLTAASYEELDARVQLLLKSEGREGELPVVVCDAETAAVLWHGQRFELTGTGPIEDEVVAVVERELHREQQSAAQQPSPSEHAGAASARPPVDPGPPPKPRPQPADPRAKRPEDARGGGLLGGVELEPQSTKIGVLIGPIIDFGTPIGPAMLNVREAFRISGSSPTIALVDLQAGIGIGAPFDPSSTFGVVARFGAEWMIAYSDGNSDQTSAVPKGALGFRVAQAFTQFSIWAGVDGQFRFGQQDLHTSDGLIYAKDVTGTVTLGVAYIDWSRK